MRGTETRRASWGMVVVALALGAVTQVACGSDGAASPSDGGAGTTGTAGTGSAGTTGTAGTGGELSLYDRLGGKSGLETFVQNVVETKILTDADLKTFFFNQVATPIPAGHPSPTQIVVCFGRFVGAALGADTYPGAAVADAANTNTPSFTCRSMVESHRGTSTMLHIGSGTFDKFIGHIATSLTPLIKPTATKAGEITQAEFDALAAALTGQKAAITTPGAAAAVGPFPN